MMISLRPFHGVLAALLAFSTVPTAAQEVPAELLKPVEEAIAADDFQKAERLLIQVSRATRGNRGMQAEVAAIRREIGALERSFQELEQERSVLKTSPQDPAASQVIGEYYAFMKGDWERGLALLAQGDNEATKAAATFDLTQPTDFQSQLNAGDLWRQVAETAREKSVISRATLRARFWYLRASELAGSESELGMIAECLDELAFYPSKIVIFNSHNGQYNGRGVLVADIKLSLDGQVVYKRRHPLAWQKGVSVPTIIHIPRNRADAVQVDVLKFYRNGGALAEIEVYQDGVNLADDAVAKVSASYDAKRFPASNLTDGDYGTPLTQRGIWVLPEKKLGWARIVWDRPNWGR